MTIIHALGTLMFTKGCLGPIIIQKRGMDGMRQILQKKVLTGNEMGMLVKATTSGRDVDAPKVITANASARTGIGRRDIHLLQMTG